MLTRAQAVAELERIYEILPQIASALADVRKPVAQYAKTSYFKFWNYVESGRKPPLILPEI